MSRDQKRTKKITTNLEKLKYDNRFSLQRDIHCIGGNMQFLSKENVCTCHLQTFPLIQWTLVIGKAGKDDFVIVCEFVCEV